MENFTPQDQAQTTNVITLKTKSLLSTSFLIALNQVMAANSLLQTKSINLLLQKNVELEKLPAIKAQQTQMRALARRYLDDHVPKILGLLTDITGFCSTFEGFYPDVKDYFDLLNDNEDDDEKEALFADISAIIDEEIKLVNTKKAASEELINRLLNDSKECALLSENLNETQLLADQLYVGDKTEIYALQNCIKELLKDIEQCNNQAANGALDSAKHILKITTTLVANYTPDKKPDPKLEVKPDKKITKKIPIVIEAIPIVENNLKLFADNKPVPTFYDKKLQKAIVLYRQYIEKLQKFSGEATIYSILMHQWNAFINSMVIITGSIEYLAKAWLELEHNLISLKEKFSVGRDMIDDEAISYIETQLPLTRKDFARLNAKAIDYQRLAYLDVVKEQDKGKDITSHTFRTVLNVPRFESPQLVQKKISKNSEE